MLTTITQRAILMALLCLVRSPFAHTSEIKPNNNTDNNNNVNNNHDKTKPKKIFAFRLTNEMKTSDLDDPQSALSKQIAFIGKGSGKASDYISVEKTGGRRELRIKITDDSIFVPGDKIPQNGFRRTDVEPAIPKTALTGITTFYQSIRFDEQAPLTLKHGYLLASIEIPTGDHIFDIFTGTDFEASNVAGKEGKNAHKIRVRDLTTKTLFELPLDFSNTYNFAVTVDWKENTLTVYASTNQEPLEKKVGPVKNDPKVISPEYAQKGEYHMALLRAPLPDPSIPEEKRSDVPHVGLQNTSSSPMYLLQQVKKLYSPDLAEKDTQDAEFNHASIPSFNDVAEVYM